jgi:carboxypeptidase T
MKRANQTKMTHLTVLASTLCVVVGCTYLQAATAAVRADTPAQITAMQEKEKVATNVYEAYFPSLEIARKAAISFHEQTLETNYETGFLVMELTPQDMSKLRSFGFKFKPAAQFMKQRKSFINGIQSEGRRRIQAESSLTRTASSAKILLVTKR